MKKKPETVNPNTLMQSLQSTCIKAAPVHLWNPDFCGKIDMQIKTDGTWFYMGTPIARQKLVELFASVLKLEGESYFLVTPNEKVQIEVEDAPFFVTAVEKKLSTKTQEPTFVFTTSLGERVQLDAEHDLKVKQSDQGEPRPYLHIRNNLYGLLARPVFYELIHEAVVTQDEGYECFHLHSAGGVFELGKVPIVVE